MKKENVECKTIFLDIISLSIYIYIYVAETRGFHVLETIIVFFFYLTQLCVIYFIILSSFYTANEKKLR